MILPLTNISPDPADAYFAEGLTEELISSLSRLEGLRVIARATAMRFTPGASSVSAIGKELEVRYALEGSVRKSGDRLRIGVRLIDAASEENLWSETYDRTLADVFAIQREIAERVVASLELEIGKADRERLERGATRAVDAYALYLEGRVHWNRRTDPELREAARLFARAIERDPLFALAHAGLADVHTTRALLEFAAPSEAFPSARAEAERALVLDPTLAEAHASLGLVRFQYDRDYPAAESELKSAIQLNPNYPIAHQYYADLLKALGRFPEALAQMGKALELDPLSLAINTGLGHVLYLSRNYDAAIVQYRKALALDPTFVQAHLWFGRPFLEKGRFDEAIAELRQAVELSKGSTISLAVLGHAYASAGRDEEAKTILATLLDRAKGGYLPSYWIALLYTGLGENRVALDWLDRAFEERSSWLAWIRVEPRFDRLRAEPRFQTLLTRMHLDTSAPAAGLAPEDDARVRAFLAGSTELKLSRFRVIGSYLRHGEEARHRLKDLKSRIAQDLDSAGSRTRNYLLWAPPGSGKTFLVREIAASVGRRFVEINLGEVDEPTYRSRLVPVRDLTEPTLVFIDEIDAQPNAGWPYELLLPLMEGGSKSPAPRVFVVAGSGGGSVDELGERLTERPKGSDLLSRVPRDGRISLPDLSAEDRIVQTLSVVERVGHDRPVPLLEVEKLALLYLVRQPALANPRQLREFVTRATERVPVSEDRLRFDHLFAAGDDRGKEFWVEARAGSPELLNRFLRVEP